MSGGVGTVLGLEHPNPKEPFDQTTHKVWWWTGGANIDSHSTV